MGTSLQKSALKDTSNIEIFSLVWLDASVNSSAENINLQKQLRTLINQVIAFDNVNECLQYIRNIPKQNRSILIVSGRFGREIVPRIHRLKQILSIYVYCMDKQKNEKWAQKFPKIKGVIVNIDELVGQIRTDRVKRNFSENDDQSFSFNIYKKILNDDQSAIDLNNQFIHFELLIDCLVRMKLNLTDKNQLTSLCKEIYKDNSNQLTLINEFEQNYTPNKALWWYTKDTFMSHLLNKSFQTQKIELLYLLRFFIRDIREQLELNKYSVPIHVYRGEVLSNEELKMFSKSLGSFMSVNSFLSTNFNRQKVLKHLSESDGLEKILFEIDADPRLDGIKPFSNTGQDDEVLFMIGSIFRINDIIHQQDKLTIIRMSLCTDNDPELKSIFKSLKIDTNDKEPNLLVFGDVLWKIGKFAEAEKYYQNLLTQLSADNFHDISECYFALGNIAMEKDDYNSSFKWHQKSLEIKLQILKENDPSLADSYNSIADIERKKGNLTQALESFNKALDIWTQVYGDDHPNIAMCLNNIGCIYGEQKNFLKTLECHEKALKIMEKHFSSDHLCLGQAYNNIGSVHRYLGNYELALQYYQLSVNIKLKSFSPKHPSIASTYSNIASVYEEMNELQQAKNYYEQAAVIYRHRFPPTHPDNVRIAEDIRRISNKLKESTEQNENLFCHF